MKELYLNPEMNVVNFAVEDIITTSVVDTTAATRNPNCGSEGEMGSGFIVP